MRFVSFLDASNHLKDVLDTVARASSITVIHRPDAKDAVIMSVATYQSMADTIHLLSDRANRGHLAESIAQFKRGGAKVRELSA
jgi:antitoxin YefM